MSHSPNAPCPCHSGLKYKKCCRTAHEGLPAATPEALMRSRFSAYALGLAEHIVRTTHPSGPHWEPDHEAWLGEIRRFCAAMSFDGLDVRAAEARGDRGLVDFVAHLSQAGRAAPMAERSLFLREGDRWLYHSGQRLDPAATA